MNDISCEIRFIVILRFMIESIQGSRHLIGHVSKFIKLDQAEIQKLAEHFKPETFGKKVNLLEAGQPCRYHYFVVKGCLRMFFINEKGNEQTIQFAIENWWITDYSTFNTRGLTEFFIQAVEPTQVLCIDFNTQENLFVMIPGTETYFRLIYQKAYAAAQLRMKYRNDFSSEDFYLDFRKRFPDFTERVPQYLLASYLGITPEYLSEIKKRHA
jgi:CRP-like cAMP-binding protein